MYYNTIHYTFKEKQLPLDSIQFIFIPSSRKKTKPHNMSVAHLAFEASLRLDPNHTPITPTKSPHDKLSYRVITLSNSLTALLVSDPCTDKAAASLDVNIGSINDPEDLPGLAHFLEHMLFLGTEKYPDENSYSKAINNYGGSQNAYTSQEHTTYIFDVTKDHLEEILDRFAQFFISPLMNKSAVDREIVAVNNEHENNLQKDEWRIMQLGKSLLNCDHPASRFSTGNFKTLRDDPVLKGTDVRERLLQFYNQYYSANLMKLCVVGKESLDVLQDWVTASFSAVPNKNVERPNYNTDSIPLKVTDKTIVKVVPVKNFRQMLIEWILPSTIHQYKSKPANLVMHCLAHEADGSLAHDLKSRGYINFLGCGPPTEYSSHSVAQVSMSLTEVGLTKVDEILKLTFAYLSILAMYPSIDTWKKNWKKNVFEEVKCTDEMRFIFKDKCEPIDRVQELASSLSMVPACDVLTRTCIKEFDIDGLKEIMVHFLDISKLSVMVVAPEFKTLEKMQQEKWYDTSYTVERMSDDLIYALNHVDDDIYGNMFHLPPLNPFIAQNFDIKQKSNNDNNTSTLVPTRVTQCCSTSSDVYFIQDSTFNVPKGNVTVKINSPVIYSSPKNISIADLWLGMAQYHMSEIIHFASEGMLTTKGSISGCGIVLSFSGFSDKLVNLVNCVIKKIVNMHMSMEDSMFDCIKEEQWRGLSQYGKGDPLVHAQKDISMFIKDDHSWTMEDRISVFESITMDEVKNFATELFKTNRVTILVSGNLLENEVEVMTRDIQNNFGPSSFTTSQIPISRCTKLDPSYVYMHCARNKNLDNTNSVCQNVYQISGDKSDDGDDFTISAHLLVLSNVLNDPLFDQLRTKETLGYIVTGFQSRHAGILHYNIAIQSSEKDALYLNHRIEAFLLRASTSIIDDADNLEKNKTAIKSILGQKDTNLDERHNRFWSEIQQHRFSWNRAEIVSKHVSEITIESFRKFFNRFFSVNSIERRKVSFQYFSMAHKMPERIAYEARENVAYANIFTKGEDESTPMHLRTFPGVPADARSIHYVDDLVEARNNLATYPSVVSI